MTQKKAPPCCFRVGEKIHLYGEEGLQILDQLPSRGELVAGLSFHTLSLEPFSFPFAHRGRIRDALKMQYRHLLPHPEAVEILPLLFSRKGKQASGAAWIWNREESSSREWLFREEGKNLLWPLPLLFFSPEDLRGETEFHALACTEKNGGVSLLVFREGLPFAYRYSRSLPGEEALRQEFGEDLRYSVISLEDLQENPEEFWHRWNALWNAYPQLHETDLSPEGAESLFAWDERLTPVLSFLKIALAGGLFFGALMGYSLYEARSWGGIYEEKMHRAYGDLFPKDRIRDPLSQARGKLRALGNPGEKSGMDLEEVLTFLGNTWKELPPGVVAESLRFTSEGAELVGSAAEVSLVQQIKKAFPPNSLEASLEGIQQIPGSSAIRFTLYLEEPKP